MALAGWLSHLFGDKEEEPQQQPARTPMPKREVERIKTMRGAASSGRSAYKDAVRAAQAGLTQGVAPKEVVQSAASRTGKRASWAQQALTPANVSGIEFANTMLDWQKQRVAEGKGGDVGGALGDPRLWWGGGGTPSTMDLNTSAPARQTMAFADSILPILHATDPTGVMRATGQAADAMAGAPGVGGTPIADFAQSLKSATSTLAGGPAGYARQMLGVGRIEAPTYAEVARKAQGYAEDGVEVPLGLGLSTTKLREAVPAVDAVLDASQVQKDDHPLVKGAKYATTMPRIAAGFAAGLSPANTVGFLHDVIFDLKSWITTGPSTGVVASTKATLRKAATEGLESAATRAAREAAEGVADKAARRLWPTLEDIGEHSLARISTEQARKVNVLDDVVEAMADPTYLREQAAVFPDLAPKLEAKAVAIEAGDSSRLSAADELGRDLLSRVGVRVRESIKAWQAGARGETTGLGLEVPLIGKRVAGLKGKAEDVLEAAVGGDATPQAVANIVDSRRAVAATLGGKLGRSIRAVSSAAERFAENPAQTEALHALDLARRHVPNVARQEAATSLDAIQTAADVDTLDRAAILQQSGGIAGELDTDTTRMLHDATGASEKRLGDANQAVRDAKLHTPQQAEASIGTADYRAGIAHERFAEAQAEVQRAQAQAKVLVDSLGIPNAPKTSAGLESAAQRARAEATGTKRAVREGGIGLEQTAEDLERAADREMRALGQFDALKTANEPPAPALLPDEAAKPAAAKTIGEAAGIAPDALRTRLGTTATGKAQTYRTWQRSVEEGLVGALPDEATHNLKTRLSKSGTSKGVTATRMDASDLADSNPELVMDILEGRVNSAIDAGDLAAARKHMALYEDFIDDFTTKSDEVPDWLADDPFWGAGAGEARTLPREPVRPDLEAAAAFDPAAAARDADAAKQTAKEEAQARLGTVRTRLERAYRDGRATGAAEQARQAASDAIRAERRAAATEGRVANYKGIIDSRQTRAEQLQATADALRAVERDKARAVARLKTADKRVKTTLAARQNLDDIVAEREAASGGLSVARELEQKFRATVKPDPTIVANDLRENAYRAAIRDKVEPVIRKRVDGMGLDEDQLTAAIDEEVEAVYANAVTPERIERATYALLGYDLAPPEVREAALARMAQATWRDADEAMDAVLGGLRGQYERVYEQGVEMGVRDPANRHDEILEGLYQHFALKDSESTIRGAFAEQVGPGWVNRLEDVPVVGKPAAKNLREMGRRESVVRQVADEQVRMPGPDASETTDLLSEMARSSKTWADYQNAVEGLAETDAFTAMARYAEESARSYGRARFAVDAAERFGIPVRGDITVPPYMRVYSLSDEQLVEHAATTGKLRVPHGETYYMMPDQIGRFVTSRGATMPRNVQALYNNLNAVTNFFKTWAAPMSPGFSMRNWIGAKWQLYQKDGVAALSPTADLEAWRFTVGAMFPSQRARLKWDEGFIVDALGKRVSYKELYGEMRERGLNDAGMVQQQLGGAVSRRLKGQQLAAEGTLGQKLEFGWESGRLNPFSQEFAVYDKARQGAGAVEIQQRAQSFIHDLRAHGDRDAAAIGAKRYLFDYGDNTAIVGTWGKIMFPFISWSKNNVPLQFVEAFRRPGRFAAYSHAADWFEETGPQYRSEDTVGPPSYIERQGGLKTSLVDENGNPVYILTPFGINDLNKVPYPSIDSRFTPLQNLKRTEQNAQETLAQEWYPMTNWLIRWIPDVARGETVTGQNIENKAAYTLQSAAPVVARVTRMVNPALGEKLGFGKASMTPYAATSFSTGLRTYPVDFESEAARTLYEQREAWEAERKRRNRDAGLDERYGVPVE